MSQNPALPEENTEEIKTTRTRRTRKTAKDAGFRTAAVYDSAFAQDEKYLRGLCDYYFSSAWEWPQILR